MGWQSIQILGASACIMFILLRKIQKMAKCTFWYRLTRDIVPDKVQKAVKLLCVCVCVFVLYLHQTSILIAPTRHVQLNTRQEVDCLLS